MSSKGISGGEAGTILAVYRVQSDARSIEARARAIAVEQSVEMPVEAIDDENVRETIVGRVIEIAAIEPGYFEVRIALSADTARDDAGQLLNMLFGNTSLQDDVELHDAELPDGLVQALGGPHQGLDGLRSRAGAGKRALTCSALKPQGLPPEDLAALARRFAEGGVDFIKDDHGLADQRYSPFEARVGAVAAALANVEQASGRRTCYLPSLSGDLDSMRRQIATARNAGLDAVLVAPMIAGFSNVHTLVREHPDIAFMAHPTMGGAARIAAPLLIGKLFRLIGMDAVVFPNYGGRFGYSQETCRTLARAALGARDGLRPAVPVPAGGMTPARVPEMLEFYGADIMLLIGGGLLAAGDRLTEETASFTGAVRDYRYG